MRPMQRRAGIASALAGAVLWGFSGTCSQFLLEQYAISVLFVAVARMLGAGAIFLVVILLRHRTTLRAMLRDRWTRRHLVLLGVAGLYLCQVTYLIAISYTNAGTATVLQSLNIVMIMLFTCVTVRRLPRVAELVGLLLAFMATLLIATQGDLGHLSMSPVALFWGLATAVAAAAYSLLPVALCKRWNSFTVVGMGMVFGGLAAAVIWLLAFLVPGIDAVASAGNALGTALIPQLDALGVGALVIVTVVGTFLAFYLYLSGIALVGAVQGSQLGAIEPVSASVCSVLLVGTAFSVPDWVGLILMVGTILLVATGGTPRKARCPQVCDDAR